MKSLINKNISVVGVGRLGLCFCLFLEKAGYDILGIDMSEDYVKSLNNKTLFTPEANVNELLRSSKNFRASTNLNDAIEHSDVIFLLVATPSLEDGRYDHSQIESVMSSLQSIGPQTNEKHLIVSCTTMPGYCDTLADKARSLNYTISYNPEFIAQGTIFRDQLNPEFVLIGEGSQEIGDILESIYRRATESNPKICRMKRMEAEICKIAYNCFLTAKISFANMIGDIAITSGLSPTPILEAIGSSDKVGHKYLGYGYGYGGPCFPRDNRALAIHAKDVGYDALLSYATDQVNINHLEFQVENFKSKNNLDKPIRFNTVTYKPGTDILEESQQLAFVVHLAQAGYNVTIEESPTVIDRIKAEYGDLFIYEVNDD